MKNNKIFILIEVSLAIVAIILGTLMLNQKTESVVGKVAVILPDSDDNRWTTLKYGLKMAAKDHQVEMFVADTSGSMTLEQQQALIEQEIANGADALIIQPLAGTAETTYLQKLQQRLPVLLLGASTPLATSIPNFVTSSPDNYAMGQHLANELLKDYADNLTGKTIGLVLTNSETETMKARARGFSETIAAKGGDVTWTVADFAATERTTVLGKRAKVNIVVALDDDSLTAAGATAANHDLKGAIVYGIGHSTEALYYLDTDQLECVIVPDEFSIGYQSMRQTAKRLSLHFWQGKTMDTTYYTLRRETLFAKENQELLFMMNQ